MRWIERISMFALAVMAYTISGHYDLWEYFDFLSEDFEMFELDEVIPSLVIIGIGFLVVSWLRVRRIKKMEKLLQSNANNPSKTDYKSVDNLINLQVTETSSAKEKSVLSKLSFRLQALKVLQGYDDSNIELGRYLEELSDTLIYTNNPGISFSCKLSDFCTTPTLNMSMGIILCEILYAIQNNAINTNNKIQVQIFEENDNLQLITIVPQERNRVDLFKMNLIETLIAPLQGQLHQKSNSESFRFAVSIPIKSFVNACAD